MSAFRSLALNATRSGGKAHISNGANTLEDHGDMKIIGNNTPRYNFGITLDAAYKGFDFSVFFQGIGKRDYWVSGAYFWGATGGMWQSAGFTEHWDFFRGKDNPLGANLNAYYPRPLFTSGKICKLSHATYKMHHTCV